jgi:CO/xanthine dehydrogenase Mo-binding subunit
MNTRREEEFIRGALAPPDEDQNEDRRQERWHDHRQFDVRAFRYRRVWLSRADRDRQHRSQGHGVVCWRWRISQAPNIRFYADVVYTNTPPAGAFRGYGVPQGYWPLDRHMEKIARR